MPEARRCDVAAGPMHGAGTMYQSRRGFHPLNGTFTKSQEDGMPGWLIWDMRARFDLVDA
jgi:hypothetical protein